MASRNDQSGTLLFKLFVIQPHVGCPTLQRSFFGAYLRRGDNATYRHTLPTSYLISACRILSSLFTWFSWLNWPIGYLIDLVALIDLIYLIDLLDLVLIATRWKYKGFYTEESSGGGVGGGSPPMVRRNNKVSFPKINILRTPVKILIISRAPAAVTFLSMRYISEIYEEGGLAHPYASRTWLYQLA